MEGLLNPKQESFDQMALSGIGVFKKEKLDMPVPQETITVVLIVICVVSVMRMMIVLNIDVKINKIPLRSP